MRKRTDRNASDKIAVDINGLQDILSVGKNTAIRIGEESGAAIKIGRRKLYSVEKINEYMKSLAGSH